MVIPEWNWPSEPSLSDIEKSDMSEEITTTLSWPCAFSLGSSRVVRIWKRLVVGSVKFWYLCTEVWPEAVNHSLELEST